MSIDTKLADEISQSIPPEKRIIIGKDLQKFADRADELWEKFDNIETGSPRPSEEYFVLDDEWQALYEFIDASVQWRDDLRRFFK